MKRQPLIRWVCAGAGLAQLVLLLGAGPSQHAGSGPSEAAPTQHADPDEHGVPAPPPWDTDPGALPPEVARRAYLTRNLSIGERIGAVSELFLDRPYQDGCAGEGRGYDPDPPARYDVFDCVTFIEEVLALALAPDPAWVAWYRTQLRFEDGEPSYEARNHFFVMQWIGNNLRAGFLEDVTTSLGEVTWIDRIIDSGTYDRWRRRDRFPLDDEQLPTGTMRLPVLTLDAAAAAVDRIPPGSLIVTVRIPLDHIPIVVSHVGITVPADQPTMRHATRMGDGRVRDDDLAWYIEHLRSYTNWPAAGISVLVPREQGPRLGALAVDAAP